MRNEGIEPDTQDRNMLCEQIFKPSSWLTKIDYVNHSVLFSNIMTVVLGEHTSGKTTFCNLLQLNLDPNIKSHIIQAKAPFSQNNLLAQLDTVFHLRVDTEVNLSNLVAQINERKAHALVIIDDAQYLPDSFLQEALNELEKQGSNGFFHLCLVSDYTLNASLSHLDQKLIHLFELGTLTLSETKTYLRNRLLASKKFDKTLTEKRLAQFYELTSGNMALINAQMMTYFNPSSVKSNEHRNYFIRGLSFLSVAALALAASSYIWKNQFLPSSTDLPKGNDFNQIYAQIDQPLPSLIPMAPKMPITEREPLLVSQLPDINYELISRPSEIPPWHLAAVKQQVQPSPKRVIDVAIEEEVDDSLVVRDRVVVIPKMIKVLPVAEVAKPTQVSRIVPITQAARRIINKAFTIQLMASPRQEDVKRFVNRHKISTPAKIRLTKREGADWYVLTIGQYNQIEHAQADIKKLPVELIRYNPWIRPLSQLEALG